MMKDCYSRSNNSGNSNSYNSGNPNRNDNRNRKPQSFALTADQTLPKETYADWVRNGKPERPILESFKAERNNNKAKSTLLSAIIKVNGKDA